jgi:hypothetical protein
VTSNNPGPNNPHNNKKKKWPVLSAFAGESTCSSYTHFSGNSVHLYSNADKNQIIDQKSHTHIPGNLQGITTDDQVEARPEGWHTFFALREPSHVISQLESNGRNRMLHTTYNIIYNYAFQLLLFFFCCCFLLSSSSYQSIIFFFYGMHLQTANNTVEHTHADTSIAPLRSRGVYLERDGLLYSPFDFLEL